MLFELKECKTGENADLKTTAEVVAEAKKLALTFRAEQKASRPLYSQDNMPLYEGDVVEIFLTLGKSERYLELEFNQNGAMFAAVIEFKDGEKTMTFVDGRKFAQVSVENSAKLWETFVEIDLEQLETLGFSEDYAFGNLLREDFDDEGNMSIYAASPTYTDTFHKPSAFVKLF